MKYDVPLTELQQRLVETHLALIRQTIFRHIKCNESICGLTYDDLYQEGACALCHAAVTYEAKERSVPFSAYARPVIRNHLMDHCRRVQREPLPTVSMDAAEDEALAPLWSKGDCGGTEDWDERLLVERVLEHGKRTYSGVAKLGMEALELKARGYSVTDIARLYQTRPNLVGAWMSRAAEKTRRDAAALRLLEYDDTAPRAAGF